MCPHVRQRTYPADGKVYGGSVGTQSPAKCAKCQNGATGLVGHFDLFIVRLDRKTLQFKCATCGTLWTRAYGRDAPPIWSSGTAEIKGMPVPGWKARPPSRG